MASAVFPGQGSQYIGMGYDLYQTFSSARPLLQEAEDIFSEPLSKIMFEGDEETLRQTRYSQPALFVVSMMTMHILREEYGISSQHFSYMAGHSLGEYSALCASGALSFSQALCLIKARGRAMSKAPLGGMAAIIGLSLSQVEELLPKDLQKDQICEIANDNAPQQVVVSGTLEAVHNLAAAAKEKGALRCLILNVSGPFHSSLMKEAQVEFWEALEAVSFSRPQTPVITNFSATPRTDPLTIQQDLVQQMTSRVLWRQTQLYLQESRVESLIEIGAGKVLCGLAKKTIPSLKTYALNTPEDLQEWARSLTYSIAM